MTESHGDGAGAAAGEPRPMAFARSKCGGLGLDGGRGRQAPNQRKEVSAVHGWHQHVQGMEAFGRDYRLGSRQPARERGAP